MDAPDKQLSEPSSSDFPEFLEVDELLSDRYCGSNDSQNSMKMHRKKQMKNGFMVENNKVNVDNPRGIKQPIKIPGQPIDAGSVQINYEGKPRFEQIKEELNNVFEQIKKNKQDAIELGYSEAHKKAQNQRRNKSNSSKHLFKFKNELKE